MRFQPSEACESETEGSRPQREGQRPDLAIKRQGYAEALTGLLSKDNTVEPKAPSLQVKHFVTVT
jgi:hypothetical protein